jgi:hypothetical protein
VQGGLSRQSRGFKYMNTREKGCLTVSRACGDKERAVTRQSESVVVEREEVDEKGVRGQRRLRVNF